MRRRLVGTGLAGLTLVTYGVFFSLYFPGSGVDPGLYGYAPPLLLSTALGCGVAAVTDGLIADRRQALRVVWYPGWAVVAGLPLIIVLAVRGAPVVAYETYPLVVGGIVGIGQEIRRW